MYVNPIPYIDQAKKFEFRFAISFDELLDVEEAKDIAAEYLLGLSKEQLKKGLACKTFPVYPESKFSDDDLEIWGNKKEYDKKKQDEEDEED